MSDEREFLESLLLAEHSKAQTMRIVHWVGQDPAKLACLLDIFMGDQYRLTQRGAWAVRYVGEAQPELMAPWLPKLVEALARPNAHDAVKRNALNVFEALPIPSHLVEALADAVFPLLENPQEAVAIRCAAMTVLDKICQQVPELSPALLLQIEGMQTTGSAGLKSRAKRVYRKYG